MQACSSSKQGRKQERPAFQDIERDGKPEGRQEASFCMPICMHCKHCHTVFVMPVVLGDSSSEAKPAVPDLARASQPEFCAQMQDIRDRL